MANYLILIYFLYEILSKLNFVILIVIEEIKNSKEFKKIGFNTRIGNKIGTLQLIWNILKFYIFFFKKDQTLTFFFIKFESLYEKLMI